MYKANFKAYEGSKPFIFVSYAHKDSDKVYPIISQMNSEGYRIWYDDGISAGSEWPEYIARHLDKCDAVLFFATPASVASDNCRREVNFAMSRSKKFLSIVLEPTDFTLGMELQLSSQQSIMKYELPSDELFYSKLYAAPMLESVRRDFGEIDEEVPAGADPQMVKEIMGQNIFNNLNSEESENASSDSLKVSKKRKNKALIPIIAGVAACLLIVGLVVGIKSFVNTKVSRNLTLSSGQTSLDTQNYDIVIEGETITAKDINTINKCANYYNLTFIDCDFNGNVDLNKLKRLNELTRFTMDSCTGISDYSFLSKLTTCSELNITADKEFKDLSYLNNLQYLWSLNIADTGVTDIKPVFTDFASSLTDLNASGCQLTNTSFTATEEHLTMPELNLSKCGLTSIAFLDGLSLSKLDISYNPLSDLTPLGNVSSDSYNLSNLDISGTTPNDISLELIGNLQGINTFKANDIKFNDLSFLKYMSSLRNLSLANCNLNTIYPDVLEQKKLEYLNISNNNLNEIPTLDPQAVSSYMSVDVSNNNLTSLSGLPDIDYMYISCYGNNIDVSEYQSNRILLRPIGTLIIDDAKGLDTVPVTYYAQCIIVDASENTIKKYENDDSVLTEYTSADFQSETDSYGYNISDWKIFHKSEEESDADTIY